MTLYIHTVKDDKISPSFIKVDIGSQVRFKCDSSGKTKWYFKTTRTEPIALTYFILLNNVESKDSGTYFCYGTYLFSQKTFMAEAELKVYGMLLNLDSNVQLLHINSLSNQLCIQK